MPLLPQIISALILLCFGGVLIVISLVMLIRPDIALRGLRKFGSTPLINVTELGIRALIGAAFFSYAEMSQVPNVFRSIGGFLMGSAVIIFCVPRRFHNQYAVFCADKFTFEFVRACSVLSLAAVAALIVAVV